MELDLNELKFNSNNALNLFDKWKKDNPQLLPTIQLFYDLTCIDSVILFELSHKEHKLNNLIDNTNNQNDKLNTGNTQIINMSSKYVDINKSVNKILSDYYLLLNNIHNTFIDRVINNVPTEIPQPKIIDTYLRYFDEMKAQIEKALNMQSLDNDKYTISIKFE